MFNPNPSHEGSAVSGFNVWSVYESGQTWTGTATWCIAVVLFCRPYFVWTCIWCQYINSNIVNKFNFKKWVNFEYWLGVRKPFVASVWEGSTLFLLSLFFPSFPPSLVLPQLLRAVVRLIQTSMARPAAAYRSAKAGGGHSWRRCAVFSSVSFSVSTLRTTMSEAEWDRWRDCDVGPLWQVLSAGRRDGRVQCISRVCWLKHLPHFVHYEVSERSEEEREHTAAQDSRPVSVLFIWLY